MKVRDLKTQLAAMDYVRHGKIQGQWACYKVVVFRFQWVVYSCFQNEWIPVWFLYGFSNCLLTYLIQKKSFVIILWNSLLQEFAYSVTSLAVQSDFNIDGILTYLNGKIKNVKMFCPTISYSQFPNHGETQLWILIIWWNNWGTLNGNS